MAVKTQAYFTYFRIVKCNLSWTCSVQQRNVTERSEKHNCFYLMNTSVGATVHWHTHTHTHTHAHKRKRKPRVLFLPLTLGKFPIFFDWRWASRFTTLQLVSWLPVFLKNGSKDFLAFLHEGSVRYWPESYTAVCPKKYRFINYSWKQVLAIFGQFLEIGVPATLDIAYSDRYHWAL